jgi:large subunit ribosomal protein L25
MPELKVEKRTSFGKATAALRRAGMIPAELYGHGIPNVHVAVNSLDFEKVYEEAGESTVVSVIVDGTPRPVLIYDIQRDPLTDKVLAVDFYQVKMDEKIETAVPLKFEGESPAVEEGGVLIKAMDKIEIEAFPQDLPEHIAVDLSKLAAIGDSLYVRDLPKGDKYKYAVGPDTVVVSVTEQEKEEVVEAPLAPEQVVVETEEKKAERQAKAGPAEAGEAPKGEN